MRNQLMHIIFRSFNKRIKLINADNDTDTFLLTKEKKAVDKRNTCKIG